MQQSAVQAGNGHTAAAPLNLAGYRRHAVFADEAVGVRLWQSGSAMYGCGRLADMNNPGFQRIPADALPLMLRIATNGECDAAAFAGAAGQPPPDRCGLLLVDTDAVDPGLLQQWSRRWPRANGYLYRQIPADDGADRVPGWRLLQEYFSGRGIWLPAFAVNVRSRCPLLATETGRALLPDDALSAPVNSAWLRCDIDLCRFVTGSRQIDEARLRQVLQQSIRACDSLLGLIAWPTAAQALDARHNRRIGLQLHGLGDVVAMLGLRPDSLSCQRLFAVLLERIRSWLDEATAELAEQRGTLPTLLHSLPSGPWKDARHRADWRRRWLHAVRQVRVRNRNLLVLSPYTVLPRRHPATPACMDLLPLLSQADAVSFAAPRLRLGWADNEYRGFAARMIAALRRLNAASFIAVGD